MSRYNFILCYENDNKFNYDLNAIIGYDENNESWFIQAFEYIDSDGNEALKLWRGNGFREFISLEHLLMSMEEKFTILNQNYKNLYDYFPTSKSSISKLFLQSLGIWATLDRLYTEDESNYEKEIDFNTFCEPYEEKLEDADMIIEEFGKNIAPENIEILREIFNSYSILFSDSNIEYACVRAKMNYGWNGINGWLS